MEKQIQQVLEFHKAFGLTVNSKPSHIDEKDFLLRKRLMEEELKEYLEIAEYSLREDVAKELADLLYVVLGTIVTHGFQDYIVAIFDEVHKSNMSKLDENGKPILRADGKVLKSKLYREADLSFLYNDFDKALDVED